ncbi:histidine-type phosphatase [Ruminococcus sp.]|uniref:histidine-type phosphatase n=1 Tax=Ruminococcus sp. TaxID=41978 RepID=UPI0025D84EDE|nr:histidine-type phosphatase [Ruminococcus sp.]MBQ8966653.1 histidine-type phosphatase [Ruminococcus sp.]
MKQIKRYTAALLAGCMILSACSESTENTPENTASRGEVTTAAATAQAEEKAPDVTQAPSTEEEEQEAEEPTSAEDSVAYSLSREGFELEQVVMLSRHNIRAPLSSKDSVLGQVTPHEWTEWSSPAAQLSLRGGVSETAMGQYFRKWLEQEEFFPENYRPEDGEVRFYSNSKQRTIATANYFKAGLLPAADLMNEYHMDFDTMDPVFTPQLTYVSPGYNAAAEAQTRELYADDLEKIQESFDLLAEVIDLEESAAYKDGTVTGFTADDLGFVYEENAEPSMTGSMKTACSVSDALVLQYYEEPDDRKAAFGHDLTFEDWQKIGLVKDLYGDLLFTAPLVAANVAHPLLEEIDSELDTEGRRFTFLCGHDSNIGSVLAALGAEDYELPDTIEGRTPIGCKLVFCKWKDGRGDEYISCDLVYQRASQLRDTSLLDLDNTPVAVPMAFTDMTPAADGLYKADDMAERFEEAISAYDDIIAEYEEPAA